MEMKMYLKCRVIPQQLARRSDHALGRFVEIGTSLCHHSLLNEASRRLAIAGNVEVLRVTVKQYHFDHSVLVLAD